MAKQKYHHGNLKTDAVIEAISLSKKKGLFSWSLRELSKHMGVSHAALYKHFDTKEEILYQVAIKGFEELIELSNTAKNLKESGEIYIKYAIENPIIFEAMFHPELPPHKNEDFQMISSAFLDISKSKVDSVKDKDKIFLKGWAAVHGYALLSTRQIIQNTNISKKDSSPKSFIHFLWS